MPPHIWLKEWQTIWPEIQEKMYKGKLTAVRVMEYKKESEWNKFYIDVPIITDSGWPMNEVEQAERCIEFLHNEGLEIVVPADYRGSQFASAEASLLLTGRPVNIREIGENHVVS
jgi:hypothetical protein